MRSLPDSIGHLTALAELDVTENHERAHVLKQQFYAYRRAAILKKRWNESVVDTYRTALVMWRAPENPTHSLDAGGAAFQVMKDV